MLGDKARAWLRAAIEATSQFRAMAEANRKFETECDQVSYKIGRDVREDALELSKRTCMTPSQALRKIQMGHTP